MKKRNTQVARSPRMKTIVKASVSGNWVTAQTVTEKTGWHWTDLVSFREEGNLTIKKVGKRGYRYDLDSVGELLEKLIRIENLRKSQIA